MNKSQTTFSKRQSRNSYSNKDQELEKHKQIGNKVIDTIKYSFNNIRTYKKITMQENSIVLHTILSHLNDIIMLGKINALILTFDEVINLQRFTQLPQQFQSYYQNETIKIILKQGCSKLIEVKGDTDIQDILANIINDYPFFRICLIIWARNKAVNYLKKNNNKFSLLFGNEEQLLFIALDIICQSLDVKLILQHQNSKQQFGNNSQNQLKVILIPNQLGVALTQDNRFKDNQTNYSQTDNIDMSNKSLKHSTSVQFISPLSPKSITQPNQCSKCLNKLSQCRCTHESLVHRPLKKGIFQHYISVLKKCKKCDLCRKCQNK